VYVGHNSLKTYDFYLFAQDVFSQWVRDMRETVRATGSQQLVTIGQDEGGLQDRLRRGTGGEQVSFTTNHSCGRWIIRCGFGDGQGAGKTC